MAKKIWAVIAFVGILGLATGFAFAMQQPTEFDMSTMMRQYHSDDAMEAMTSHMIEYHTAADIKTMYSAMSGNEQMMSMMATDECQDMHEDYHPEQEFDDCLEMMDGYDAMPGSHEGHH